MSCEQNNEECFPDFAKVGQPVPPFTLEAFDPEEGALTKVDLGELREKGKWTVLFFYPADFTFVCPTELADLATKKAELDKLGVEVVSVSTDTQYSHMAWQREERLLADVKFKMAGDPTGEVSRFFDVWDYESGLALRGTFVLNPEGVLVSSEINFFNVGRNADELVRKLEANTYLIDHPAEVCPAKWTPGQKTLAPSDAMVGKVYEALND